MSATTTGRLVTTVVSSCGTQTINSPYYYSDSMHIPGAIIYEELLIKDKTSYLTFLINKNLAVWHCLAC